MFRFLQNSLYSYHIKTPPLSDLIFSVFRIDLGFLLGNVKLLLFRQFFIFLLWAIY